MKKIFFAVAIIAMGQVVVAQEKTPATTDNKSITAPAEMKKHKQHDGRKALKELNLSDEQKTKLKEFKEANKQKKDAIVSDTKLTEEQKKEQLKTLHQSEKENMQSVLTDEQKAKLKELKAQRKEMRKGRIGKSTTSAAPKSETNQQ